MGSDEMTTGEPTTADSVRQWALEAREAIRLRDERIRQMHDEGATYRAIAEAAGLSPAGVQRIVKRRP